MKNVVRNIIAIAVLCAMIIAAPSVNAAHTADVYWVDASAPHVIVTSKLTNDTLVLKAWQWNDDNRINITFCVNNTKGADINRVQVHIPENQTEGALFHYLRGFVTIIGWDTRIPEKDFKGWARLIEFYTTVNPIKQGVPANFTMELGDFRGKIDTNLPYEFAITTMDTDGGSEEHSLYLLFDTKPPVVEVTFTPAIVNGRVNGLIVPCGNHYFNITVRAVDESGLMNYSVVIYDAMGKVVWRSQSAPNWRWQANVPFTKTWQVWNLDDGNYTLNVTFFDMVGNNGTLTIPFTYVSPPRPMITLHPSSGPVGTPVTVRGVNFDPGTKVDVKVVLPPPYGEIKVANATVKSDGTFETSFTFPETPRGYYIVNAYGIPCNRSAIFELTPQITLTPNEVIGPATINVEATGYIKPDVIPGSSSMYLFVNSSDAIQGVNLQSLMNWYINENGTLQNMITYTTGRIIECGFYWPALEPGTYNITLFMATPGSYWNRTAWVHVSNFEHSTIITVKDWTGDILDAANAAKSAAEGAKSSADAAKSSADAAKSSADAAKSSADSAKSSADAAKSSADAAKSSADSAKSSADAAKSSADAAKSSADSAAAGINDAKTSAENAKNAAQGLTVPVYLAVIFSLIAAIIAAACAVLVYRKIA
jgi:hypothetical protein